MKKYLVPAVMLGAAAIPASAAEVQIQATGPVVELSVSETVQAQPDLATISAGVSTGRHAPLWVRNGCGAQGDQVGRFRRA